MEIEDCIQQFREACGEGRIIAYGPHVQAEALQAAARAGCEVYTRGQIRSQDGADSCLGGWHAQLERVAGDVVKLIFGWHA